MRQLAAAALRRRAPAPGGHTESSPGAAAAAVVAALRGDPAAVVAAAVERAGGDRAICRWVAETDVGTISPGRDGLWHAHREATQERAALLSLADALVWVLVRPLSAAPTAPRAPTTTTDDDDAPVYRYCD